MSAPSYSRSALDWWGRGAAGLFLGGLLALGLSGLFARFGSGEIGVATARAAASIWLFVATWLPVFALSFRARSAERAWVLLGAFNLLVWAPHFLNASGR